MYDTFLGNKNGNVDETDDGDLYQHSLPEMKLLHKIDNSVMQSVMQTGKQAGGQTVSENTAVLHSNLHLMSILPIKPDSKPVSQPAR